ncbi:MAG: hypothetical protein K0R25_1152 [Rickettsiaceae bacterium]|jgi:hypothetical protein|nr:hypothetical protein [Rickettsiaceae bacterium]
MKSVLGKIRKSSNPLDPGMISISRSLMNEIMDQEFDVNFKGTKEDFVEPCANFLVALEKNPPEGHIKFDEDARKEEFREGLRAAIFYMKSNSKGKGVKTTYFNSSHKLYKESLNAARKAVSEENNSERERQHVIAHKAALESRPTIIPQEIGRGRAQSAPQPLSNISHEEEKERREFQVRPEENRQLEVGITQLIKNAMQNVDDKVQYGVPGSDRVKIRSNVSNAFEVFITLLAETNNINIERLQARQEFALQKAAEEALLYIYNAKGYVSNEDFSEIDVDGYTFQIALGTLKNNMAQAGLSRRASSPPEFEFNRGQQLYSVQHGLGQNQDLQVLGERVQEFDVMERKDDRPFVDSQIHIANTATSVVTNLLNNNKITLKEGVREDELISASAKFVAELLTYIKIDFSNPIHQEAVKNGLEEALKFMQNEHRNVETLYLCDKSSENSVFTTGLGTIMASIDNSEKIAAEEVSRKSSSGSLSSGEDHRSQHFNIEVPSSSPGLLNSSSVVKQEEKDNGKI